MIISTYGYGFGKVKDAKSRASLAVKRERGNVRGQGNPGAEETRYYANVLVFYISQWLGTQARSKPKLRPHRSAAKLAFP